MPTLVQFDFPMKGPWGDEMAVAFRDLADIIGRAPGLHWKIWTENESEETGGGIYLFDDEERALAYVEEHTARLEGFGVTDIRAKIFQVNEPLTALTRGPSATEVSTDAPELGRVTDRRPPFKYSALTRVWFSDTDAQGVVYYGRYLPYFDHARTEYHRHLGGLGIDGAEFVMRASNVEYHAPARFDDLLECFVRVQPLGRTSVSYDLCALRLPDDTLMVTATQTLVLDRPRDASPDADPRRCARAGSRVRGRRPPRVTRGVASAASLRRTLCSPRRATRKVRERER